MIKKKKKLVIIAVLLVLSVVVVALGLRYFPLTKVIKMPAASEKEYADPVKYRALPPNTLQSDFEVAAGKEMPGGFYKGLAHSGQYSVKAFGQNSFTNAIERTAGEIGIENLKRVSLSAWVYVFPTKNDVQGSLVFTASNELGVNVIWQGAGIREPEVPRGKWFKVSGSFDLSSVTFKPGYKIQIYFWNNSRTDILVDDYYVVFGTPAERRGDSARVDLTRPEGYVPRFNYPPFRVKFLEREAGVGTMKPADLRPADLVVAGDFFGTGNDGLFIIKPDGKLSSFVYCTGNNEFRKVTVSNPGMAMAAGKAKKLHLVRSPGTQADRIIIESEKGWLLCELSKPEKPCQANGTLQTSLVVPARSERPAASVVCGNFSGNGQAEILEVSNNGTWQLLKAEQEAGKGVVLKPVVKGGEKPVALWDQALYQVGISSGKFLPRAGHDVILTVTRSKGDLTYQYSLLRLDPSRGVWDPVYPARQQQVGLTIGLDTLKPEDRFMVLKNGNENLVYRYNRDWRFDLKEIRFSDTAFAIVSSIDFNGFELDRNPKYYETLALIPCFLTGKDRTQLLVTGNVARQRRYEAVLPDFVGVYSIVPQKAVIQPVKE